MTLRYYRTEKGYVATDSGVVLRAKDRSVGDTVVFGRGPALDWDSSSITDQAFIPRLLIEEVEAKDIPQEWQDALGIVPVKNPVKISRLVSNSGLTNLSMHDAQKDRGLDQIAIFLGFCAGILVGIAIAYYSLQPV